MLKGAKIAVALGAKICQNLLQEIPCIMPYLIPFTQYLRPDGRTRTVTFETSDELIEDKAKRILNSGLHFECEVLNTGVVSLTISNDDEDLASELCDNGPYVIKAIEKLILNFQFRSPIPPQQVGEPDQNPTKPN